MLRHWCNVIVGDWQKPHQMWIQFASSISTKWAWKSSSHAMDRYVRHKESVQVLKDNHFSARQASLAKIDKSRTRESCQQRHHLMSILTQGLCEKLKNRAKGEQCFCLICLQLYCWWWMWNRAHRLWRYSGKPQQGSHNQDWFDEHERDGQEASHNH